MNNPSTKSLLYNIIGYNLIGAVIAGIAVMSLLKIGFITISVGVVIMFIFFVVWSIKRVKKRDLITNPIQSSPQNNILSFISGFFLSLFFHFAMLFALLLFGAGMSLLTVRGVFILYLTIMVGIPIYLAYQYNKKYFAVGFITSLIPLFIGIALMISIAH